MSEQIFNHKTADRYFRSGFKLQRLNTMEEVSTVVKTLAKHSRVIPAAFTSEDELRTPDGYLALLYMYGLYEYIEADDISILSAFVIQRLTEQKSETLAPTYVKGTRRFSQNLVTFNDCGFPAPFEVLDSRVNLGIKVLDKGEFPDRLNIDWFGEVALSLAELPMDMRDFLEGNWSGFLNMVNMETVTYFRQLLDSDQIFLSAIGVHAAQHGIETLGDITENPIYKELKTNILGLCDCVEKYVPFATAELFDDEEDEEDEDDFEEADDTFDPTEYEESETEAVNDVAEFDIEDPKQLVDEAGNPVDEDEEDEEYPEEDEEDEELTDEDLDDEELTDEDLDDGDQEEDLEEELIDAPKKQHKLTPEVAERYRPKILKDIEPKEPSMNEKTTELANTLIEKFKELAVCFDLGNTYLVSSQHICKVLDDYEVQLDSNFREYVCAEVKASLVSLVTPKEYPDLNQNHAVLVKYDMRGICVRVVDLSLNVGEAESVELPEEQHEVATETSSELKQTNNVDSIVTEA